MQVTGVTGLSTNTTSSSQPAASATSAASAASATPFIPGGALNQNSFLTLLATQLQHQDPLQPQDNTQFVAQLAQFSSLQQMTNIATQESQVAAGVSQLASTSQLNSAFTMLGDNVNVLAANGSTVTGTVSSVQAQNGQVMITVNGSEYPVASVQSVSR